MSPFQEDPEVIQATDQVPLLPGDKPHWWRRFCDGVRRTIGLKPVELAEQFARANIRKINSDALVNEAEAQKRLSEAQLNLEAARKIGTEEARSVDAEPSTRAKEIRAQLEAGRELSDEDADQALLNAIKMIEMAGGKVELEVPSEEELDSRLPADGSSEPSTVTDIEDSAEELLPGEEEADVEVSFHGPTWPPDQTMP